MSIKRDVNGYKVFDLPNGGQLLWAEEDRVLFSRMQDSGIALTTDPDAEFDGIMEGWEQAIIERDRLRKELEEAAQAMSVSHKNLWFKWTNERNRAEEARIEAICLARKLEEERKQSAGVRRAMQDVLYYLQRDSVIPAQGIIEQYLAMTVEMRHLTPEESESYERSLDKLFNQSDE